MKKHVCPHGVPLDYTVETVERDGAFVSYFKRLECLRCMQDAGLVVLMPTARSSSTDGRSTSTEPLVQDPTIKEAEAG